MAEHCRQRSRSRAAAPRDTAMIRWRYAHESSTATVPGGEIDQDMSAPRELPQSPQDAIGNAAVEQLANNSHRC
ncbi:MAG: hypothetical protein ACLT76_02855 [Clostridium fessum]